MNANKHLRRLVVVLTLAVLVLAWGLVGLSFLLGLTEQGYMLIAASLAATLIALILCGLAFGKVRIDHEPEEDDDYGFGDDYEPAVNIDGTPMVGGVDLNGNPYGFTTTHRNHWD